MGTVKLFQRQCRVIAGPLVVEGLRCKFHVTKTSSFEPNTLKLAIYGLSQDSRAQLQGKGIPIILEAGYEGTTTQIFSGPSRTIDHRHVGPDWISEIQCGDGEVAYRWAFAAQSFAVGARVADVFAQVAQGLEGIDVADAIATVQANVTDQYTQGYSAFGPVAEQIDHILSGRGLEWSIQDGKLQVLLAGQATNEAAILISEQSGLIGSPEHGEPHSSPQPDIELLGGSKTSPKPVLKVKSLLLPLVPKQRVIVQSEAYPAPGATFVVQYVEHTGDSFGGDWYSELECV